MHNRVYQRLRRNPEDASVREVAEEGLCPKGGVLCGEKHLLRDDLGDKLGCFAMGWQAWPAVVCLCVVVAHHLVWFVCCGRFTFLGDVQVSPDSEPSWETETEKLCSESTGMEDSAYQHASGTPLKGDRGVCICLHLGEGGSLQMRKGWKSRTPGELYALLPFPPPERVWERDLPGLISMSPVVSAQNLAHSRCPESISQMIEGIRKVRRVHSGQCFSFEDLRSCFLTLVL